MNNIRIVIGGEHRIGLLDLTRRIQNNVPISVKLPKNKDFDCYTKNLDYENAPYNISLWEFSKFEHWNQLLTPFIKESNAAILIYELVRTFTLDSIESWVAYFRAYDPDMPIILVGTKPDIHDMKDVYVFKINEIIEKCKINSYIKVSTLTGENLDLVFKQVISLILKRENEKSDEKISEDELEKLIGNIVFNLKLSKKPSTTRINSISRQKYTSLNHVAVNQQIPTPINRDNPNEYSINEFITLKLEHQKSQIYIKNKKFMQCKYLLFINPQDSDRQKEIDSIDEASEYLTHCHERNITPKDFGLSPGEEFWGHCSNLQVWAENNYNSRLLHRNLAFPMLKALTDAGDPLAKKVFKDEIAERLSSGFLPVVMYLIEQNYLDYFNREEIQCILDDLNSRCDESQDGLYWMTLGIIRMKMLDYDSASKSFKRAMEKNPHNSNYWLEFGKCYARFNFKNGAIECFERASELENDNPDMYDEIAWEFYSNSMLFARDKAVEYCDKAIKLDPERVRSWYIKAEALKLLQENAKAIQAFKKVLEINPKVAYVWHSMGMVYKAMGKYLSAMGCFVKAAEIASNKKDRKMSLKELRSCYNLKL